MDVFPLSQSTQLIMPWLAVYRPGSHQIQSDGPVALVESLAVPGGHSLHCSRLPAPNAPENLPSGHAVHTELAVACEALLQRPASHSTQSVAPIPAFAYRPEAQELHTDAPTNDTRPGLHMVVEVVVEVEVEVLVVVVVVVVVVVGEEDSEE